CNRFGMYWFGVCVLFFFFFQAEDGIRDDLVTGVQTCALPICREGCRRNTVAPAAFTASAVFINCVSPSTEHGPAITCSFFPPIRSEERRVGKECRSRLSSDPKEKRNTI